MCIVGFYNDEILEENNHQISHNLKVNSNVIVIDENLYLKIAHDLEILWYYFKNRDKEKASVNNNFKNSYNATEYHFKDKKKKYMQK